MKDKQLSEEDKKFLSIKFDFHLSLSILQLASSIIEKIRGNHSLHSSVLGIVFLSLFSPFPNAV
ncbi:hypothetical protein B1F79_00980 [Coxiella-like endosymbiont of Rhipicephalus sanguineus]|nr:hypothetical protein [Coxiella-like endosymbiont of Rhipicephalus sanguineus]